MCATPSVPEATANLTVNPDFATIEADQEFVNLTRFEPQLTEKRPFFLEGNEKFRQRIPMFYSRRIADIDFGGKLLSRTGLGTSRCFRRSPAYRARREPATPTIQWRARNGRF